MAALAGPGLVVDGGGWRRCVAGAAQVILPFPLVPCGEQTPPRCLYIGTRLNSIGLTAYEILRIKQRLGTDSRGPICKETPRHDILVTDPIRRTRMQLVSEN